MFGTLIVFALTFGGGLASLRKPYYGLVSYICLSTLRAESFFAHALPSMPYARIAAICLLLGWALSGFGNWNLGPAKGIVIWLICFWLWVGITSLTATNVSAGLKCFENIAKIVLPFLVAVTVVDSWAQVKGLMWAIVLCLGFISFEMNLSYLKGYNVMKEQGFGGWDNNTGCVFLIVGLGPAIFLALDSQRLWQKGIAAICCVLIMHTILLSFSRGGMASMIIVGGIAFLMMPKRWFHYAAMVAVVLVALRLAGPEVRERFFTVAGKSEEELDSSAQSRKLLRATCMEMMTQSPLVGKGPANFQVVSYQYGWSMNKAAHTTWFQAGAEMGAPGMFLMSGFFIYGAYLMWRWYGRSREGLDPVIAAIPAMVVSALAGYMFGAHYVSSFGMEPPYFVMMIAACYLKLRSQEQPTQATSNEEEALQEHGVYA